LNEVYIKGLKLGEQCGKENKRISAKMKKICFDLPPMPPPGPGEKLTPE